MLKWFPSFLQMVRKYDRNTKRQVWSKDDKENAVAAVVKKEMGLRKASAQFNVPKTTMQKAVQHKLKEDSFKIDKSRGKFQSVFSKDQENEPVNYLKDMEGRLFGLSMKDFRALAFQLAEKNNLAHPFNKHLKMAGEDWMHQFLLRHPDLNVRKPDATEVAQDKSWKDDHSVAGSIPFRLCFYKCSAHANCNERV